MQLRTVGIANSYVAMYERLYFISAGCRMWETDEERVATAAYIFSPSKIKFSDFGKILNKQQHLSDYATKQSTSVN